MTDKYAGGLAGGGAPEQWGTTSVAAALAAASLGELLLVGPHATTTTGGPRMDKNNDALVVRVHPLHGGLGLGPCPTTTTTTTGDAAAASTAAAAAAAIARSQLRSMLRDTARVDAYARALARVASQDHPDGASRHRRPSCGGGDGGGGIGGGNSTSANPPAAADASSQTPFYTLDIGAGTGLLAMLAAAAAGATDGPAKAGAHDIDACEMYPPLAALAADIVRDNDLQHRVAVHACRSTDFRQPQPVGQHPQPSGGGGGSGYHLLVTEIFDSALLGEGVLPVLADARERLLHPDARVVPDSARVFARLVESPTLFARWFNLDAAWQATCSMASAAPAPPPTFSHGCFPFHRSPAAARCIGGSRMVPVHLDALEQDVDYSYLSEPFQVFEFDFSGRAHASTTGTNGRHHEERAALPQERVKRIEIPVTRAGTPHALILWWELDMTGTGDILYSTESGKEPWQDHWLQCCYPLPILPLPQSSQSPQLASVNSDVCAPLADSHRPWGTYKVGQSVALTAGHTALELWFSPDHKATAPRPCSCGFHVLRGGPYRISALSDAARTTALREGIAKCIADLDMSIAPHRALRILDISDGSSLCALLAAEVLHSRKMRNGGVLVASLETENDHDSMDALLYNQIAHRWAREGKIAEPEDEMDEVHEDPLHFIYSWEDLDAYACAGPDRTFDLVVAEPWHAGLAAHPTAMAASLWLRRAALSSVLSSAFQAAPNRCVIRGALLEFAVGTLSESFQECGRVHGIDHSRLDRLCQQQPGKFERISIPLYMYRHRELRLQGDDDEHGIAIYTFNVTDMPPNGVVCQRASVCVRDAGRLDALAVWAEYDGLPRHRTEHSEILWLKDRPNLCGTDGCSVTIECCWDRTEIGCFAFDIAYTV